MTRYLKECKHHGITDHRKVKRKGMNDREQCCKCQSEAVKRRRNKLKEMAVEYKGSCCNKCGYNKSITALEFHHLDPSEKDFGISNKGETRSWERIKKELDKCVILCANCHREEHERLDTI